MGQQDQDQHVTNDPEFHALPAGEKHKVLMATDPDYRGMQPSEQAKALDEIHYGNLGRDESKFTGGTRNKIADAIDTGRGYAERGVNRIIQNFGLPTNEAEANHFIGQDPGQKPALKELIDAGPRALPVVGPSMQASDDARAGKWPEVAGDLVAGVTQMAPFKGPGMRVADAAGAVVREPGGELRAPIKAASEIGGAAAGASAARTAGGAGPYIGAGIGYKTAPRLIDAILPERAPIKRTPFRQNVEGTDWTPPGDKVPEPKSEIPKGKPDPFAGATSSGSPNTRETGPWPKPKMTAKQTGEYLKSKGTSVGKESPKTLDQKAQEAYNEGQAEGEKRHGSLKDKVLRTSSSKENLSPAMQKKVGEAQGRYDARRMAEAGALRDEDSRTGRLIDEIDSDATATEKPSRLRDAVSGTPDPAKPRPVSQKVPDSQAPETAASAQTRRTSIREYKRAGGKVTTDETAKQGDVAEAVAKHEARETVLDHLGNKELTHHGIAKGLKAPPNEILHTLKDLEKTGDVTKSDTGWKRTKLKDKIKPKGESYDEMVRRGAPGESPNVKSLRRKVEKWNTKDKR